jgi:DNA-binding Xre family transcriptional regulator
MADMTNLAKLFAAFQKIYDLSGKELAKEIGIAESTITRLRKGKMPDAAGLVKIMAWMTK